MRDFFENILMLAVVMGLLWLLAEFLPSVLLVSSLLALVAICISAWGDLGKMFDRLHGK